MLRMKNISNVLKVIVGLFILYQYWYNSSNGHIMTSDECRGLLYLAVAAFAILCPIDFSIFIKNWKEVNKEAEKIKKEVVDTTGEDDK